MKMELIGNLSVCDTDTWQPQAKGAEIEFLKRMATLFLVFFFVCVFYCELMFMPSWCLIVLGSIKYVASALLVRLFPRMANTFGPDFGLLLVLKAQI